MDCIKLMCLLITSIYMKTLIKSRDETGGILIRPGVKEVNILPLRYFIGTRVSRPKIKSKPLEHLLCMT